MPELIFNYIDIIFKSKLTVKINSKNDKRNELNPIKSKGRVAIIKGCL